MNNKKFPYQIHLVLGIIWIVIGMTLYSGTASAIWIVGGLIMIIIGFFNRKKA